MDNSAWWTNFFTLIAGLGGALLGAGATALLTWTLSRQDRRVKQKAEFFQLMIKLSLIQTDFVNLKNLIEKQVIEAQKSGIKNQPLWSMIQPNAGQLDRISIDPSELVCLYEARAFEAIAEIIEAGMMHATIVDAFNIYSELRINLKDYMPKHSVAGPLVTTVLSKEQLLEVTPRLMELESTIVMILERLPACLH